MILRHVARRECRLDWVLRRELQMSSTLVSRLKWQNAFFVNGQPAHTNYRLSVGDLVEVRMEEQAEGFPAQDLPLSILFEDDWLIALDKPVGMLVHPSPSRNEGTLANGLRFYYEKTGQTCAVHPVSRLDRDTFGVVLLAKNAHVHAHACRMQKECAFCKLYHAAVFGGPEADCGTIDLPIRPVGGGSLLRTVDPTGQKALTEFQVLSRQASTSLLQLRPVTGRTHQLRLHCLSCGFPILGDPQYTTDEARVFSQAQGLHTQQLCAKSLQFVHPMTGEQIFIVSDQDVVFPR